MVIGIQPYGSLKPKRINIRLWILISGNLNTSDVLQKKLPSNCIMPSICPSCLKNEDNLDYVFFDCSYANLMSNVGSPVGLLQYLQKHTFNFFMALSLIPKRSCFGIMEL